jgi:hypothetical protein
VRVRAIGYKRMLLFSVFVAIVDDDDVENGKIYLE